MRNAAPLTGRWGSSSADLQPLPERLSALAGCRVALTDAERLDAFAALLASRGADVHRFPLVTSRATPDAVVDESDTFKLWLADLLEGRVQDMIWTTPDGIREALRLAARCNADWQLVAAMARVRTFVSGLSTARTLQQLGFLPDLTVPKNAGDANLIKSLRKFNLIGRTVGVQLHTAAAGADLMKFLQWMRADVRPILPYEATTPDDQRRVQRLVRMICAGHFDAIAFSDASEARLLQAVAARTGELPAFTERLAALRVVALSPRVAGELGDLGIRPHFAPSRSFFVWPMVDELMAALGQKPVEPRLPQPIPVADADVHDPLVA